MPTTERNGELMAPTFITAQQMMDFRVPVHYSGLVAADAEQTFERTKAIFVSLSHLRCVLAKHAKVPRSGLE